jgi:hypothetical protein
MNKNIIPVGHVANARPRPDLTKQTKEDLLSKIDGNGRDRLPYCPACSAQRNGVKSRIALPPTCGR